MPWRVGTPLVGESRQSRSVSGWRYRRSCTFVGFTGVIDTDMSSQLFGTGIEQQCVGGSEIVGEVSHIIDLDRQLPAVGDGLEQIRDKRIGRRQFLISIDE